MYLATAGADEEYAACAIVTKCLAGSNVPYLCKFAVSESAQGTGVADALWARVKADHADGLYWRSHAHSPINPWFFQRAEGTYRAEVDAEDIPESPPWTVFWYGGDEESEVQTQRRVAAAMDAPRSFFDGEQ